MKHADRYEYVIVGAGSAGCTIASWHSKHGDLRVQLIEQDPPDKNWTVRISSGLREDFKLGAGWLQIPVRSP